MQLESIRHIAVKELELFFSSPIAYLFLGVYVFITLFIFFWVESFFLRNIADVRPMFEWKPILLILLSSALTMRMWSEERRSGTLEFLMTVPLSPWSFVLGKFTACIFLMAIALSLTLPIPISISLIADVDWGPIISGYIATMFLGSAYLSIGLFVSSRSDNQIVSLIVTIILCSVLYMFGSELFLSLVNQSTADILRTMGSGSRFESITRGLLDFRDFYYYLSIVIVFLVLNRYNLENERWVNNVRNKNHIRWYTFIALAVFNALFANVWLASISGIRVDTTEGNIYSISDTTRGYFKQLEEPLLIRGYFSEKTHPYFAPLIPQLKDLVKEYEYEANGSILAEFIDPAKDPKAEEVAGDTFGIYPNPFRVDEKYQSAVLNSYFSLLVKYGAQYKVINFTDLIEQKSKSGNRTEIRLRNPEYTLTNAIKTVLYEYQKGGNFFDNIQDTVKFTAYVSTPENLPASLKTFFPELETFLNNVEKKSRGRFSYEFIDPESGSGRVAKEINKIYGFQPMLTDKFGEPPFYFYMILSTGDIGEQIHLPQKLSINIVERDFDSALRRFATGFTKTVGVVRPKPRAYAEGPTFDNLLQMLRANLNVSNPDITSGIVPGITDLLMLLAPEKLDSKALFAMDQFLMKGGTVITTSSSLRATFSPEALSAEPHDSGIKDWLTHHGIEIDKKFVFDPQSNAFPMPVVRTVGEHEIRETVLLEYPLFIDVRSKGLNQNVPITSSLQSLTIPWASPIIIDSEKNTRREVLTLIESSPESWLSNNYNITPAVDANGVGRFTTIGDTGKHSLAVSVRGEFTSFFAGQESPLLEEQNVDTSSNSGTGSSTHIRSVIQKSPPNARLIVVGSNSFSDDESTGILTGISGNNSLSAFEFLTNATEWSLEDADLLGIRSRANFNRTLPPMKDKERQYWELLNYAFAFFGVLMVFLIRFWLRKTKLSSYTELCNKKGAEQCSV